jgi:hypothetical protein
MLELIVCLAFALYGAWCYYRVYTSDSNWYTVGQYNPITKKYGAYSVDSYAINFCFAPMFGTGALIIVYDNMGGELNYIIVFITLLGIVLLPLFMIDRFKNRYKKNHQ